MVDTVTLYPQTPQATNLTGAFVQLLQSGRTQAMPALTFATSMQNLVLPYVGALTETHAVAAFTDGGGASGTRTMTGSIPAGAVLLGTKVLVPGGFTGNTTAVLTIGDGSDVDRYMTGTPSVFTTDTDGIETGVPSGNKLIQTANQPVLTVTGATDFTAILADGTGIVTVSIYYIATV